MKYYIGLDGGGTKTKCVLSDADFNIIAESAGGPSTFLLIGADTVASTILKLILNVTESAGINLTDIEAIVLGTTGAGRRPDAELLEEAFAGYISKNNFSPLKFHVDSDARIALEGAFTGRPGSILIAGTGSIMFGKDKKGMIHRVGGFGRFIGDEGSGYMLGRRGLIAVAKSFDGRGEYTVLSEFLKSEFGIDDPAKLITEVYKNKFDIASVAPLVIESAKKNDTICRTIIESEISELLQHISAMKSLLKMDTMNLCLIGSTLTTENYYSELFKQKVTATFDSINIIDAELPPHLGAVVMAKAL
ncbi:MAG: hypothetical protein JW995_06100 [Melioribacteraceae bacterium]|nr:hypothetical protein [Melioribacteraceae bacterium]